MDLARFEEGLDRYGADLSAWPAALQADAVACLDTSAAARAAHGDLQDIEAYFRMARPAAADAGRIASRAMRHRQDRPALRAVRRTGWAVAAVVALILGLFVGGVGPDHEEGPDHAIATAFDQLAPLDVD